MSSTFIQTEAFIYRFRKAISSTCETARSIDRNDSWGKIAKYAIEEGFNELAEALEASRKRLATEINGGLQQSPHYTTM